MNWRSMWARAGNNQLITRATCELTEGGLTWRFFHMHSRALRRALALATIPILALFTAVLGFSSVASAHDVSGISANCNEVTVQFVDFPPEGVSVHIAATVEGHPTLSSDVLVKNNMTASLDIASATSALAGATAAVNVDVTWTFQGAQHVHETLDVTCGTHHCGCTTTTTAHATTTTTAHHATTTTTVGGVTATTESTTTSTSPNGGGSTNTTSTSVGGESVTGSNGSGSGGNGVVLGANASDNTGGIKPTANRSGSLPFTGS